MASTSSVDLYSQHLIKDCSFEVRLKSVQQTMFSISVKIENYFSLTSFSWYRSTFIFKGKRSYSSIMIFRWQQSSMSTDLLNITLFGEEVAAVWALFVLYLTGDL